MVNVPPPNQQEVLDHDPTMNFLLTTSSFNKYFNVDIDVWMF